MIAQSEFIRAAGGTYSNPDKTGASMHAEHCKLLEKDLAHLAEQAKKGGTEDLLDEEWIRYVQGYEKKVRAMLGTESRFVSSFISGPSNYPARRMQKIGEIARRRSKDAQEFRDRALQAIVRKLRPELAPIMTGDSDAAERLAQKIEAMEAERARMVLINKLYRKSDAAGLEAIGLNLESLRNRVAAVGYSWVKAPFEPSNLGARIRDAKARLETVKRNHSEVSREEFHISTGIAFADCPAENRVRLTFPDKPSEEVRKRLKSNGFRWTPSLGVWQAYRNHKTIGLAEEMAKGTA